MRPLIHWLIAAPAPGPAGRVRRPGHAGTPSRALSASAGGDQDHGPDQPGGSAKDDPPRPPKRPRTPANPDPNDQATMWPDLWAIHRC